jgi:hypothetical protein
MSRSRAYHNRNYREVKRSQPVGAPPLQAFKVAAQELPFGGLKIGSVCVPAPLAQDILRTIEEKVRELLGTEGMDAFAMPRSAALAHEVGHCIVGAAQGMKIDSVAVFARKGPFGLAWGGITNEPQGWQFSPAMPTSAVIKRARFILGGLCGELVLDPEGCRSGSSLDELVLSQVCVAGVVQDRPGDFGGRAEEEVWQEVFKQTCWLIKSNEDAARALIRKLDRAGELKGKPLAASLHRVQRVGGRVDL